LSSFRDLRGRWTAGLLAGLFAALLAGTPSPIRAQEEAPPTDTSGEEEGEEGVPVSPGGAFVRSMLVPGWGQAAVGSLTRGGFYFVGAAGTGWMLYKTTRFLGAARDRVSLIESEVEAELRSQGITDPVELADALDGDERVEAARDLEDVRTQQLEDWIAFGIFWILLNGADAFVSAHLADFPEPIEVETATAPGPDGTRRVEVGVRIPVGGRPR